MTRKQGIKKPPSGATEGGGQINEQERVVIYSDNSTNPAYCQIDYAKLADVLEVQPLHVYRLRADEARLLMLIQAGGTIYPI